MGEGNVYDFGSGRRFDQGGVDRLTQHEAERRVEAQQEQELVGDLQRYLEGLDVEQALQTQEEAEPGVTTLVDLRDVDLSEAAAYDPNEERRFYPIHENRILFDEVQVLSDEKLNAREQRALGQYIQLAYSQRKLANRPRRTTLSELGSGNSAQVIALHQQIAARKIELLLPELPDPIRRQVDVVQEEMDRAWKQGLYQEIDSLMQDRQSVSRDGRETLARARMIQDIPLSGGDENVVDFSRQRRRREADKILQGIEDEGGDAAVFETHPNKDVELAARSERQHRTEREATRVSITIDVVRARMRSVLAS